MTKKALKDALSPLSKTALIDLILELNSLKDVKVRLENRFTSEEDRKKRDRALFEQAHESIYKAFYPARLHIAKGCVSKSTKAITEFKAASSDKEMLAELLVYQIELISKAFGNIEGELYYNSMINTTERNIRFLMKDGQVGKYLPRLRTALRGIDGDYDLLSDR